MCNVNICVTVRGYFNTFVHNYEFNANNGGD